MLISFYLAASAWAQQASWNLSEDGRYSVVVRMENGQYVAYLKNSFGTWKKTDPNFIKAMTDGMKIQVDGKAIPVKVVDTISQVSNLKNTAPVSGAKVNISLYGKDLADLKITPGGTVVSKSTTLSSFDIRNFSSDATYPKRFEPTALHVPVAGRMQTDIHTHLAGHLEFDSLMRIAKDNNFEYPTDLLDKLKIRYPQEAVTNGKIPFRMLLNSPEFKASNGLANLEDAMTIEKSRIRTFSDMEEKYLYRGPITKNPAGFRDMLWEVAKSSAKSGVNYTEQSISNIIDPEWLKIANTEVPKIEKELGVKVRFIVGLWRHSDPEWNLDEVSRVKVTARASPYIVGIDFMGHETNETKTLGSAIKAAADLRKEFGSSFQVRVHAGENPLFPANVREAAELGATRVGHGLYIEKDMAALKNDPLTQKIDPKVLETIKNHGLVMELNPLSNQALNNLSGGNSILLDQFRQFKDAGIPVVFSTDGIGMYGADHTEIVRMLKRLGFTEDDFAYARQSEKAYLEQADRGFAQRAVRIEESKTQIPTRPGIDEFVKKEGQHYTSELAAARTAERKARLDLFHSDFAAKGIQRFDMNDFKKMKAIDVSGGSQSQFAALEKEGRLDELKIPDIRKTFDEILKKLDPSKAFFLTGGTQFGVEKILHEEIQKINATFPEGHPKFKIVGVLPEAAHVGDVLGPGKGGITQYLLGGKTWSDFSRYKLDILSELGGIKMAVAGKMFVADEFRYVRNSGLPIKTMYMDGPVGASSDLARENPSGAFKDGDSFFAKMDSVERQSYVRPLTAAENLGNRLAERKRNPEIARAAAVPAPLVGRTNCTVLELKKLLDEK